MMELFVRLLRSSSALWVGPFAVTVAIWYSNKDLASTSDPYLVAHSAAGFIPLFLTLPIAAACAAWEGGRLRRAGWTDLPNVRSLLVSVGPLLVPPLVVGLAAAIAGLLWTMRISGVGPVPDLRFLPVLLAMAISLVLLGFAVGMRLPVPLAAPLMLAGLYAWMVVPVGIDEPVWLRHLSGNYFGFSCCRPYTDIHPAALVAPVVVSVGISGTALLMMMRRPEWANVPVIVLPLAIGLVGGSAIVRDLDRAAELPRALGSLVCAGETPRVCVWPEHAHLLGEATNLAATAVANWHDFGVGAPSEFTEAIPPPPGAVDFGARAGSDRDDLLAAFAYAMMPAEPQCAESAVADPNAQNPPYLGFIAEPYLHAWYGLTAGANPMLIQAQVQGLVAPGEPDVMAYVAGIRQQTPPEQGAWVERTITEMGKCGVLPDF